jgi:hypothetical protein
VLGGYTDLQETTGKRDGMGAIKWILVWIAAPLMGIAALAYLMIAGMRDE